MRPLLTATLALILVSMACVRQERFRFVPTRTACFEETADVQQVNAPPDQRPSLDCRHTQYKMAFIEFDQQGKAFDPNQAAAALKLIEREKVRAKGGKIITVVYVHGWKNNAAEALPGGKPKDVEKFQNALLELGYRAEKASKAAGAQTVPVVGVYIAWRGKTLMGPSWFTFASLWSRRNTANRIGDGPDLAPILNQVIKTTNDGNSRSRVLLIGHSFGARVLEHAIESKTITLYDAGSGSSFVNPHVDLVLYVNSANDSRLSLARVQELQASRVEVRHPDFDPKECGAAPDPSSKLDAETRAARCRDYPLVVAITSKGDLATKRLLPIANTINGDSLRPDISEKLPPVPTTGSFADGLPSAGTVRKVAAGHFGFLQSHQVREITCPASLPSTVQQSQAKTTEAAISEAVEKAVAKALGKGQSDEGRRKEEALEATRRLEEDRLRFDRAMHPVCSATDPNCRFIFRTLGDEPTCFQADQRTDVDGRLPFNRTPFWIMSVEPTVIKDHGDIWTVSFIEMLGQLMAPRGFFEADVGRIQLRTPQANKQDE